MKWFANLSAFVVLAMAVGTGSYGDLAAGEAAKSPAAAGKPEPVAKGHLLRYKFRANQMVHFRVKHQSTIRITKGRYRETTVNESETRKHFTVIAIDRQGNAILEPVIDWVSMSVQFDEKPKKTYDSRTKKTPDRRFAGVAKTIGRALVQLKVSPTGRLLKAAPLVPRKVQKTVVKNAGPPTPANDASKNFLIVFPDKPIRVGESWIDDRLKVSLQVGVAPRLWREFKILRRYELVSVKDGKATLKLKMTAKKPINNPRLQAQLAQRLIAGTIVFDVRRGAIVSRRLTVDAKILGAFGNQSILHVTSVRTERFLTREDLARGKSSTLRK